MKQKGFTLIELLVVVAIIGILAAVGVVAYNGYTNAAKKAVVKSNLQSIVRYMKAEMIKCSVGIEMEDYEKGISGGKNWFTTPKDCAYRINSGTEHVWAGAFNSILNIHFKDVKNPFNNDELMVHYYGNKSGQGIPKTNQAGRIHCYWDAADAKGTWENFMKNNIGACDARYGTGKDDLIHVEFKTMYDYDYHRANWK